MARELPVNKEFRCDAFAVKTIRTKKEDGTDKVVTTFLASSDVQDRYEDIVSQEGWLLGNYRKNPVVQTDHNWTCGANVGRAIKLEVGEVGDRPGGKALYMDVEWDMADEDAAKIAGKVERGFLNAVSVGFRSKKWTLRNKLPKEHAYYSEGWGYVLEDNELYELSVVVIPANQEAIAQRSAGNNPNIEAITEAVIARIEAKKLAQRAEPELLPWARKA